MPNTEGCPLRMPPNCNGGSKLITVLKTGPGVVTYIVTPAHIAIHERDKRQILRLLAF
jgi:hypothetical protein